MLSRVFDGDAGGRPAERAGIEVCNPATEGIMLRVGTGGPARAAGRRARARPLRAIAERLGQRAEELARLLSLDNARPFAGSLVDRALHRNALTPAFEEGAAG
ncbi:MAG: hypothetical protein K0S21_2972 [Rhizobiaceae bacterium]|nr:hypothetical protein [Rhizobiaceae bacterium]